MADTLNHPYRFCEQCGAVLAITTAHSHPDAELIREAVKRIVAEYGEVLRRLGDG
jgi:hypothetical protein